MSSFCLATARAWLGPSSNGAHPSAANVGFDRSGEAAKNSAPNEVRCLDPEPAAASRFGAARPRICRGLRPAPATPSAASTRVGRRVGVSADYLAYGREQTATTDPLFEAELAFRMGGGEAAERRIGAAGE